MHNADPALTVLMAIDRQSLSIAIEVLVALLDAKDGDPDIEANGDELDHSNSEDDDMYHGGDGPGCPVADPDCCIGRDDTGTDHRATRQIGFDRFQGGNQCEDAESTHDREEIDEREPDEACGGHCQHYGIDQTKPLAAYYGAPVPIEALS